jgi:pimeloyl-ACP methyl ester carboxylesterase
VRHVAWSTETLNGLHLDRFSLLGMSFGGWIALRYAEDAPERVQKLVRLSPGGLRSMVKQFTRRGMVMEFLPTETAWLNQDRRAATGDQHVGRTRRRTTSSGT